MKQSHTTELIKIECQCCGQIFIMCRRCYRGHIYCSEECRISGKREARREAQRRYRQTENGKKKHSEAEKRRRKRTKKIKFTRSNIIKSCMCIYIKIKSFINQYKQNAVGNNSKCCVCGISGVIVENFSERGYGKKKYKDNKMLKRNKKYH